MKQYFPASVLLLLFALSHSTSYGQAGVPKNVTVRDGVSLHYFEQGEGEPVVFIHGLTGDYSDWLSQVEAFANANYRAITYSRRYNFPNRNQLSPNHSASVEADDLAALIRKLRLEKAHVVGHSYGGYAALMLALRHPELIRTLTLAEPPLAPWLSSLSADKAAAAREHSRRILREGVFPARAAFESGNDELAIRTMIDAISGTGKFEQIPDQIKDRMRRNVKEMKAVITSGNAYPFVNREKVRRLTLPTLMLSGSSSVATAKFTDPELERLLPKRSRQRIVLQGATHNMWIEQPVQCREAVLEFIRGK